MDNVDQFIEELNKKDDDLKIIEQNQKNNYIVVETDIDFGDEEEDTEMISEQNTDIFVRIIRRLFAVNAVYAIVITLIGFLPDDLYILFHIRVKASAYRTIIQCLF